jgi:small-conductance mechanosensitive channel
LSPVLADEFSDFRNELSSLPRSAAEIRELHDALTEFEKTVAQRIKLDLKTADSIDNRLMFLDSAMERFETDTDTQRAFMKLIHIYKNYRTIRQEMNARKAESSSVLSAFPAPSTASTTIQDLDDLRRLIHAIFLDIKGQYSLALNFKEAAFKASKNLRQQRVRQEGVIRRDLAEWDISSELADMEFAYAVLEFQDSLNSLQRLLSRLELQRKELAQARDNVQIQESDLLSILSLLSEQEERERLLETGIEDREREAENIFLQERENLGNVNFREIIPMANKSVPHSQLARHYAEFMSQRTVRHMQSELLERLQEKREFWKARFDLYNGGMDDSRAWLIREQVQSAFENSLSSSESLEYMFRNNYNLTLQRVKEKQNNAEGEILDNLRATSRAMEDVIFEARRKYSIDEQQHLLFLCLFMEELDTRLDSRKYVFKIRDFWRNVVESVWNAVLWETEEYFVTVKKLVLAICIVLAGIFLSHWLSRSFERHMKTIAEKNETLLILLRQIAFYSLLYVFVMIALKTIHVPLTVFTFIGGSVAVGIGFGMQSSLSNLFSAISIITHRPINVRDVVEIGGQVGVVTKISSYTTVVQCYDGTELIVPNRYFIENSIMNWTRKTPTKRIDITFAASIKADPDELGKAILDMLKLDARILTDPVPLLFLKKIDRWGLEFAIVFWLDVFKHNPLKVSSSVLSLALKELRAKNLLP